MMRAFLQGVLWVTGVYFYFLIFAQFSFLEVLDARQLEDGSLRLVMGAMALGGIVGSMLVLPLRRMFSWSVLMRVAAAVCALFPVLAVLGSSSFGVIGYAAVALGIGIGLGMMTVLLAANLAKLMPHVYLGAGLGTGLAYTLSNLPWIFQSAVEVRCYVSAAVVLLLTLIPLTNVEGKLQKRKLSGLRLFPAGVVCFTMLVWLDSAAFYIIQHHAEMKLGTWGESYLWRNAIVHLVVAVLSGWLLLRGRIVLVLTASFVLLGVAGLMASEPGMRLVAGYLYPAGVSFYSVALILYPAVWLGQKGATLRAVVLFSIAGWVGSAMGIGMAQDLNEVPGAFVVVAGLVMISPFLYSRLKHRKRELAACGVLTLLCLFFSVMNKEAKGIDPTDQIALGREVYISEGCIHCHSRYVRPNTRDVLLWGPAGDVAEVTSEKPVIIGNRRQGPDLLKVGLRRSKGWMRQHFIDPQSLDANSLMPAYAYLFEDDRGDALVEFLASYDSEDFAKRQQTIYQWLPSTETRSKTAERGNYLFSTYCASCHGEQGMSDGALASLWVKPPANLVNGPFAYTSVDDGGVMLARVIKFGIPGTDMPGHELLSDSDVKTLVDHVKTLRKK